MWNIFPKRSAKKRTPEAQLHGNRVPVYKKLPKDMNQLDESYKALIRELAKR